MKPRKPSVDSVRIITGGILITGLIVGVVFTFLTVVDWSLTRKIFVAVGILFGLILLEVVTWRRRKDKRGRRGKLPGLLELIVLVIKGINPETNEILQEELVIRIFRLSLWCGILIISVAALAVPIESAMNTRINPLTPTFTQAPTSTSTLTPSLPPSSASDYYMIILDASEKMKESFDKRSKWDAALESVKFFLGRLNQNSNYGLVVVGSQNTGAGNPCEGPTEPLIPIVSNERQVLPREDLSTTNANAYIAQLQPGGGGSFDIAFSTAANQLGDLPTGSIKSLLYITGSSDACDGVDEWNNLKRLMDVLKNIEVHSEIIILDEDKGVEIIDFAEYMNRVYENVNVQVPQDNQELQQANTTALDQVTDYVQEEQAALSNHDPIVEPSILSPTPQIVVVNPLPTFTAMPPTLLPPTLIPPTPLPPPPDTSTPIPQPTFTLAPSVTLSIYRYIDETPDAGCDVEISMTVTGSTVTGHFHVWNASFGSDGDEYETVTIQSVGTEVHRLGLGGNQPEFYEHEIWFRYNGIDSQRLTTLFCPNNPP